MTFHLKKNKYNETTNNIINIHISIFSLLAQPKGIGPIKPPKAYSTFLPPKKDAIIVIKIPIRMNTTPINSNFSCIIIFYDKRFNLFMKKWFLVLVFFVIILSGCTIRGDFVEVNFTTDDGFVIYGDFYRPENPNGKALILLHMLRTDKSHWIEFAQKLKERGYYVLAIDLRGHGKSVERNGKRITWQDFDENDFKRMVLDVKAAKLFLIEKGIDSKSIGIIGASIGANTALNYAASDEEIRIIALLSPGLDYRGVKTEDAMKVYDRPVFIAASKEDEPAASSSLKLYEIAVGKKELNMYENAGHGTRMFASTNLMEELINWLENTF
jgi:alpha-beta hydrolase superfamily lysophospholipase